MQNVGVRNRYHYKKNIKNVKIPTHLRLRYDGQVFGKLETKSSHASKGWQVTGGILDNGYTGEVQVILQLPEGEDITIEAGTKVAQLLILPLATTPGKLPKRGDKGFGSTGSKYSVKFIRSVLKTAIQAKTKTTPQQLEE